MRPTHLDLLQLFAQGQRLAGRLLFVLSGKIGMHIINSLTF